MLLIAAAVLLIIIIVSILTINWKKEDKIKIGLIITEFAEQNPDSIYFKR